MDSNPATAVSRRQWFGLAVLVLPTMVTMMDISVLFLALPQITVDLDASAVQQLWVTDIYGFLIAGFLVTMGTLGDKIGRRKLLLAGAAAFGLVSILAAYSTSPEMLIATRALLGIVGATIMPSTLALIMEMFRAPKDRGIAIAVWASALTLGVAVGPAVGGLLLQWFWWGSGLLIGVPVMVLLLATGPILLPEFRNPNAGRLDPLSVVLSLAAILPFIYGFKEVSRNGWEPVPVLAVVVGLTCGTLFVLRQLRLAEPLLDVHLFTIRAVSGALVLSLMVAAIQGGSGLFVTQYLQLVHGMTPLRAGLWVLVPTLALILGIFVSQGLARQVKPAFIMGGGTLVAAAGMLMLTQVTSSSSLALLIVGFTIVYLGVAPTGPLVSQLVVPSAPPEKAGSAASLQSTSGELGVALGIATLGTIGMSVYHDEVEVPAQLAGTPAGEVAGDHLAGAVEVAQGLPATVSASLLESARDAFSAGLDATAWVCAFAFLGLTVMILATLRHLPPMNSHAGKPGPDAAGSPPAGNPLNLPAESAG